MLIILIIKMSKIRYGLKLRTDNESSIPEADELINKCIFDYVELFYLPNHKTENYPSNVEVIHAPHANNGFNIADNSKRDYNLRCMEGSIKLADRTKAKYIIVHAGNTNNGGNEETAKNFLNEINDSRIIVENKPIALHTKGTDLKEDATGIGYNTMGIINICSDKYGICLDFSHAAKAALSLKKNYGELIEEFLKLEPKMFHLNDTRFDDEKDEHLHLGEGKFNLKFLKECVEKNKYKMISLETPRGECLDKDLENLLYFKNL